ncbi:hypothetical protein QUF61_07770 [Candidatus Venteria ishoeyi]|uniref:hypothetical protein n=1 Tax=Candidatus Venteria ishoeyi TaxID=1899563 RepID=UPI0025A5F455|nr:hypothetical protein [Candidatus Venteria ishoeyi]MDM8546377.1 hypothetical protein [Candidatus Venteria ishoeyi]
MADNNPAREFYRALDTELRLLDESSEDSRYVKILQRTPEKDPILALAQNILFADSSSVNLLTGFRGNGKSTELRRLKWKLEAQGCVVVLIDMANYMLFTKPVEISDFTLSLMAGLSVQIQEKYQLDNVTESYWERLSHFLDSEVQFEFSAKLNNVSLGMGLKNDPGFKKSLQKALRGHYGNITQQAREYVTDLVTKLREKQQDPDLKVVLLVDSVEQIRGIGISDEAQAIHDSVRELFYGQAGSLRFPLLHVVYTIPPFLPPLMPGIGKAFGAPVVSWPNVHVRKKNGEDDKDGLKLLEDIITRRYMNWRQFFNRDQLQRLSRATGGDLRDFFRVLREALIAASVTEDGVTDAIVEQVKNRLRREHLPIAIDDARWLAKVHDSKGVELESVDKLAVLERFFDNNLIMNYLNGEDWYDVHPLLLEEVRRHGVNDAAAG